MLRLIIVIIITIIIIIIDLYSAYLKKNIGAKEKIKNKRITINLITG